MTITLQSTDITLPAAGFVFAASNDGYYILAGATVSNTTAAPAVSAGSTRAGVTLVVDGTLISGGAQAVDLNGGTASVVIGAQGLVTSNSVAAPAPTISLAGTGNNFSNLGTVLAPSGTAVELLGSGSTGSNGGFLIGGARGMLLNGTLASFTNGGTISANSAGGDGVALGGASVGFTNLGRITAGSGGGASGIETLASTTATIVNTGTIAAAQGAGVNGALGGALTLTNDGTITAAKAVIGSGGGDRIINTGVIIGTVDLGAGNDILDTIGGTITGSVAGGIGNDLFRTDDAQILFVEAAAAGTDTIQSTVSIDMTDIANVENLTLLGTASSGVGNTLGNVIRGSISSNRLLGEGGNDTVLGLAGDDEVEGGTGNDSLSGGSGRDTVSGDAGNDVLQGDSGDDLVFGGAGNDHLTGGDGDDSLYGGAGLDTLTGGAGSDRFVFRTLVESGFTALTRDSIADYEAGVDDISVSAIDADADLAGNQAFTYVGANAFDGTTGQLRFVVSGLNGILQGDVDGDQVADFHILLLNRTVLNDGDLSL